jgi:hypothetical protein
VCLHHADYNKLGHGILVVDADDLDNEGLEIAVESVLPPQQMLISLEGAACKRDRVAVTSPTPVVLYAWSEELDFPQLGLGVSCSDVAFSGLSKE